MARVRGTRRSRARSLLALVGALAVHALGLWGGWYAVEEEVRQAAQASATGRLQASASSDALARAGLRAGGDPAPIEIRTIDDSATPDKLVEELSKLDDKTEEEKRREEKKREDEERAAGQVVQIARPAIEERPEHARFAAEYDSSVSHETRGPLGRDRAGARFEIQGGSESRLGAERAVKRREGGLPGPRATRKAGDRRELARPELPRGEHGQDGGATTAGPDGTSRRPGATGIPDSRSGARGRPGSGSGGDADADRLGMGQGGAGGPSLAPSEEMLNRAIARGAGSSDYLEDVDDGESTALNAKRFKYATFMNRVHNAVDQNWFASELYVRRDPLGNVYGTKDRVTWVRVHLKPDGALASVTLLESSGVSFLDDEALDAVRRAAPFVNPPSQMAGSDGLIHFNFGFFVMLNDHPHVKVFRYK